MGGRNAKPVELHLLNGNKRGLTKAEIKARKEQEGKLRSGATKFKLSPQVKNDPVAHSMFKKLKKLYKGIEYVEGLDENIINRYCLVHSEYLSLSDMRKSLTDLYNAADTASRLSIADNIIEIDKQIEKKMNMLIKLEDRLFLNPTARIKNVPKKEQPKEKDSNADLFD